MESPVPYKRYVVVQLTGTFTMPRPVWHDRALTAADGLRQLEARIADQLLDRGTQPMIALVDCAEGRVIAASNRVHDVATLVHRARSRATVERTDGPLPPPNALREISGGPLTPSENASYEAQLRPLVDQVSESFFMGHLDTAARRELCTLIEEKGPVYGYDEEPVSALDRVLVANRLADSSDDDVRDALELDDDESVSHDEWIRFTSQHVIAPMFEDADLSDCFAPHYLTDSDGRTMVLVKSVRGYSIGGLAIAWQGPLHSWEEFLASLPSAYFVGADAFDRMPKRKRASFIRSARGMTRGR